MAIHASELTTGSLISGMVGIMAATVPQPLVPFLLNLAEGVAFFASALFTIMVLTATADWFQRPSCRKPPTPDVTKMP